MVSEETHGGPDRIVVAGHDLVEDLIGQTSFSAMVHLLLAGGALPTRQADQMLDAILVTFTDHGVTPSSLATRLTLLGAPEALQSAVAAGLCGAGSQYLGTMENTAQLLCDACAAHPGQSSERTAESVVAQFLRDHRNIPGLGHPEHKNGDPRVPKLLKLAERNGFRGEHCDLLLCIPAALQAAGGPKLPVNAAGLAGAIVIDMGFDPVVARGLALIARCAGLVGQALDETRHPQAQALWDRERRRALEAEEPTNRMTRPED
jgi:citrate synthase